MFGLKVSRNTTETSRLEAFSDGVLAIAITLLVLDIPIPARHGGDLGAELRHGWPHYIAFVTAFLTIAVMWANHHDLFRVIDKSDRGLMLANAFLLVSISFLPFPTGVLAEHMQDSGANRQAALLTYGGTMFVIAIAYNVLWRYVQRRGLLRDDLSEASIAAIDRAYNSALVVYGAALLLSFFNAWLSIATWIGLAVFFQLFGYEEAEG
ncbi:MAG: TMEM175 family protein [Actinomycetes bacterium]